MRITPEAEAAYDRLDKAMAAKFGVPYLTAKLEHLIAEHRRKANSKAKPALDFTGAGTGRRTSRADKPGRYLIQEGL